MAGALFFIALFLISVGGVLLFRPTQQVNSIAEYSNPSSLEQRKDVTKKMASFLEQNPQMVKTLGAPKLATNEPGAEIDSGSGNNIEVNFQHSNMKFKSLTEYDQWVYSNASRDPIAFIRQMDSDNPELYIDTLKKVAEIDRKDEVHQMVKTSLLDEARKLLATSNDGFHQQMAAKALQNYLNLEKDLDLGKKTAEEVLRSSNKPSE